MNSKIIVTFLARFGSAVAAFAIAIILSQFLGTEGKGKAALLILNISFINLFTNIMGGAALVYLAPRFHSFTLLLVSYIWIPLITGVLGILYYYSGYTFTSLDIHTFILSIILGWFNTNTNLLLGKQKTHIFNILSVIQVFITLIYLLIAFYGSIGAQQYSDYITALYIGYGVSFLASFIYTTKEFDGGLKLTRFSEVLRRYVWHGGYIQLANLGQLLIYRASFYMIGYFHTLSPLGIYSNAIAIAESIWIVSRSISTILYSEIANEKDINVSKQNTIRLRKTNLLISIGLVATVCFLPDSFYTYLFGRDFKGLQEIIWALAPGIVAFSYANLNSHFFSGIGKNHINTIISFSGFGLTAIIGIALIPSYSTIGAAITASLVYIITAIIGDMVFIRTKAKA
jgi:O-antigen/teichoic acid export membrane protein